MPRVLKVMSHHIFDTPDEVIAILQRLARNSHSRSAEPTEATGDAKRRKREPRTTLPQTQADAHRLGEVACWKAWGSRANVEFKGHSQRGAPHYFRICRREDIGMPLEDHGHDVSSERFALPTVSIGAELTI